LTTWQFGIKFGGTDNCSGSVLPLRISASSKGFIALPLGGLWACDWWRGRRPGLPVTVYCADPKELGGIGGFLCYSDDQPQVMSEPQAWCHPCRVKLLVQPLVEAWQYVGAVADLDALLKTYILESNRFAVQWAVDERGWQPNCALTAVPLEVSIRKCGESLQISPLEAVMAWEIAKIKPPRISMNCSRLDEVSELVEYVMVIGRECFIKDTDYEFSSQCDWYFRRQRHSAEQYTSVPSPRFASAPVYVRPGSG